MRPRCQRRRQNPAAPSQLQLHDHERRKARQLQEDNLRADKEDELRLELERAELEQQVQSEEARQKADQGRAQHTITANSKAGRVKPRDSGQRARGCRQGARRSSGRSLRVRLAAAPAPVPAPSALPESAPAPTQETTPPAAGLFAATNDKDCEPSGAPLVSQRTQAPKAWRPSLACTDREPSPPALASEVTGLPTLTQQARPPHNIDGVNPPTDYGARARAGGTSLVAVLHAASVIGCWGCATVAASLRTAPDAPPPRLMMLAASRTSTRHRHSYQHTITLAAPVAHPQHPMTLAACNAATRHVPPALALAP